MQMISFAFFGLVLAVFLLLRLVDAFVKDEHRSILAANGILLAASYAFMFYADWRFAAALAAMTIAAWGFAKRKDTCKYGIIFSVAVLAVFKYTNFFLDSFARLFGYRFDLLHIILPLGISFYAFSAISYLADVSRKKIEPASLLHVALYLSFFPKLLSGPIQSSGDFFGQVGKKRTVGWASFAPGIQIFVFGLFKKMVLADHLLAFVDQVYGTPLAFGSLTVFMAAVAYSLQIYFDFSGYSDMAIGVAKVLGFDLPRNFNLPYLAHNVTEFWKRWHITLSTWLHTYLYIPLGGNRKGTARTYINLLLTMLIGGIWHGANWTYVLWGLLHGAALAAHKMWMALTHSSEKKHSAFLNILSVCLTFLFTTFCWIFFRADSISQAFLIIGRILSFERGLEQPYFWLFAALIVLAFANILAYRKSPKGAGPGLDRKTNVSSVEGYYPFVDLTTFWGLVVFFVFCGMLLCLAYTDGSPFIYGSY